jgi:uncharacterized membrane protein YhaH (DUF805 family)
MSTSNPYTPPRAEVSDVQGSASAEVQPVKVWSARGRIGRLRYLAYFMTAYWLSAVGGTVAMLVVGDWGPIAIALVYLPLVVLLVLSSIQRSHDMGWSGWTSLLTLIPLVGFVWVFKRGTLGHNRFGAPPSPNTLGVKLGAVSFVLIPLLGILAAIALPAYQQYTQKAKAAQVQVQPK